MCRVQSDNQFVQFKSLDFGYRAFFVLVNTYITKYHIFTLYDFVNRFAPSSENNSVSYLKYLCDYLKVDIRYPFFIFNSKESKYRRLVRLACAVTHFECGVPPLKYEPSVVRGYKLAFDC